VALIHNAWRRPWLVSLREALTAASRTSARIEDKAARPAGVTAGTGIGTRRGCFASEAVVYVHECVRVRVLEHSAMHMHVVDDNRATESRRSALANYDKDKFGTSSSRLQA
jgi:hypothetical protein